MNAGLAFYRLATAALEPIAPFLLRRRARRGKEDLARLGERLGRPSALRPPGKLIWLHGASVGEGLSLLPLAEALQPAATVLVTTGTITSAKLLAERLPAGAVHQYAPIDAPEAARRFLDHWRPDLAVFVESELWPNLILSARKNTGARLALLSARLSKASLDGWARAPGSAKALLSAFDLVMAQDDDTALALKALGARDDGRLNLKLLAAPLPVEESALSDARRAAGAAPVLLAASTHEGEEALVLEAFAPLKGRARLVIVPRHPSRGEAVEGLARAMGLTVTRQGAGQGFDGRAQVHVSDTLGELGLWFRLARAALIGGSLVPGPGGHNPLEPALLHCSVIAGDKVENWRSVYAALGRNRYREVGDETQLRAAFASAIEGGLTGADEAQQFAKSLTGGVESVANQLIGLIR